MPDVAAAARREGLEFIGVGAKSHPVGSLGQSLAALGKLKGLAASRFTIQAVAKTSAMVLDEGPEALRATDISMLLVDQMEPAGGTLAERLGLPFVTICNALALNREPDIPPPFSPWRFKCSRGARIRNRIGYFMADQVTRPIREVVNQYRTRWGLKPWRMDEESFSSLAQISQQPSAFDYPRTGLPPEFHYTGPLRGSSMTPVAFPWERLDGRPLIYASLGTLQNSRLPLFRCFAEACHGLDAQLVLTHGGGLSQEEAHSLPADVVVVSYAPQLELLSRASLTLSHAGLNTVLDSLSCGVPVIAVPLTYEQPAIAERLRFTGAGEIVAPPVVKADRLRHVVRAVLSRGDYARNASRIGKSIGEAGGVRRAADIILQAAGKSALPIRPSPR
jgi:MGT family glycosyltransferase